MFYSCNTGFMCNSRILLCQFYLCLSLVSLFFVYILSPNWKEENEWKKKQIHVPMPFSVLENFADILSRIWYFQRMKNAHHFCCYFRSACMAHIFTMLSFQREKHLKTGKCYEWKYKNGVFVVKSVCVCMCSAEREKKEREIGAGFIL